MKLAYQHSSLMPRMKRLRRVWKFRLKRLHNCRGYFPFLFYPSSRCDSPAICCGCKCLFVGIIFSLSDYTKPNPSCRRHTNTHARISYRHTIFCFEMCCITSLAAYESFKGSFFSEIPDRMKRAWYLSHGLEKRKEKALKLFSLSN